MRAQRRMIAVSAAVAVIVLGVAGCGSDPEAGTNLDIDTNLEKDLYGPESRVAPALAAIGESHEPPSFVYDELEKKWGRDIVAVEKFSDYRLTFLTHELVLEGSDAEPMCITKEEPAEPVEMDNCAQAVLDAPRVLGTW